MTGGVSPISALTDAHRSLYCKTTRSLRPNTMTPQPETALPPFEVRHPQFAQRVRASFARQTTMQTLGAALTDVLPGEVVIAMDWGAHLTQQHGFLHGGIVGTSLDSACGYAALTLMAADVEVLTIEYKVNFLAPAKGERFRFIGTVVKPGRTITVSEAQAFAVTPDGEKRVATMTCTLMAVPDV